MSQDFPQRPDLEVRHDLALVGPAGRVVPHASASGGLRPGHVGGQTVPHVQNFPQRAARLTRRFFEHGPIGLLEAVAVGREHHVEQVRDSGILRGGVAVGHPAQRDPAVQASSNSRAPGRKARLARERDQVGRDQLVGQGLGVDPAVLGQDRREDAAPHHAPGRADRIVAKRDLPVARDQEVTRQGRLRAVQQILHGDGDGFHALALHGLEVQQGIVDVEGNEFERGHGCFPGGWRRGLDRPILVISG